jgi:DNA excision repair protein ERCC-3
VHTYRLTKLGLWNARAAGHDADFVLNVLNSWAKFPVPTGVDKDIRDTMSRFGTLELHRDEAGLLLASVNEAVLVEVTRHPKVSQLLEGQEPAGFRVRPWARGQLKQELLKIGWPAEDYAGFTPGEPLTVELNESGWSLRDYQRQAVEKFCSGGSGVVVLPCGSGKTLVGAAAMGELDTSTLILVTNTVAGRQWRDELLARTNLTADQIGEYSGAKKEVAPVTIATYQILTSKRKGEFAHLSLLNARDWGLVIYDEVHLLPAPVFKLTAELQARRRLGLTATLVREDSREGDVFSLI